MLHIHPSFPYSTTALHIDSPQPIILARMAAPALQARLNYLTDAAHLLACSAPEASAYLMTRRRALTSRYDIRVSDVEKQHACAACGNILIPGRNSALKIESDRALRKRRQQRLSAARKHQDGKSQDRKLKPDGAIERAGITKTVSCDRCGSKASLQVPPPPAVGRPRKVKVESKRRDATEAVTEAPKPSANAVSKKRAKNRKAGLQALLAENKSKSSPGLTLANFMKR